MTKKIKSKEIQDQPATSVPTSELDNDIELRSEEVQEVLGGVPHWILRRGIVMLGVFLLALLIGSWFFKYPEVISAELTLTTKNPPANVVAKSGGKISDLFVRDLQSVKENQPLALIENPATLSDVLYLDSVLTQLTMAINKGETYYFRRKALKLGSLQASFSNLLIQIESYNNFTNLNYYPRKIASVRKVLAVRLQLLKSSIKHKEMVEKQHALVLKAFEREKALKAKNITSDDSYEQATSKLLQSEISVNSISSTVENMQLEIMQQQESLVDMEQEYIEKKSSMDAAVKSQVNQMVSDVAAWKMSYLLSAPIDGKVTFTEIWSENQNIVAGKTVFTVVPETATELVGKAKLPINRSGKVKAGQGVNVRFNNFPDNQFGMVKGVVKGKSLIPTEDGNYIVEVSFPKGLRTTYGKTLPLSQEMTAKADVITEDTRLLEQLFLPLKQVLKNQ